MFLGNLGSNKYGIKLLDSENSANTLFKLGEDGNVIQSKTLEAGSGSLLDLDTGVFQIGGTTNPNFRVDNGGDVQSSGSFDIDGFAIARAIRQKVITITQNNKDDFFTTYSENIGSGNNSLARLHLDGSQGGDVAAHVILDLDCYSTSNYNGLQGDVRCIGDIVAPEIPGVGSDDGASSFTIEIADGRRVELVNTRDFNVTSTSNSKAYLMASITNATVYEESAAALATVGNVND